jgi:DNA-binding transcriptional MerR regulator
MWRKEMDKLITIGKLSLISGVSARSIRHYESIGLLKCAANSNSNYRLYGEDEVNKLQQLLLFRSLGFSLKEIAAIMAAEENDKIVSIFENRLKILKKEMAKLGRCKEMLEAVTHIYKTHGLHYVNNFHVMKEMVAMNSRFIKVFNELELRLQIKILKELYRSGSLSPETLREIGAESGQFFLKELHMTLVKTLLNGVDREVEKDIMETLEKVDTEFANEAKKAMFTFDDFAKLPDDVIRKWVPKCDDHELAVALQDSRKYLKNKILLHLPPKRAEAINKEMESSGSISLDRQFAAMTNLIGILRSMEAQGDIVIERFE